MRDINEKLTFVALTCVLDSGDGVSRHREPQRLNLAGYDVNERNLLHHHRRARSCATSRRRSPLSTSISTIMRTSAEPSSTDKSYELPDEEMKTKSESFEKGKKASDYLEKMRAGGDEDQVRVF